MSNRTLFASFIIGALVGRYAEPGYTAAKKFLKKHLKPATERPYRASHDSESLRNAEDAEILLESIRTR